MELTLGSAPGLDPRVLRELTAPESLRDYRDGGGYRSLGDPLALLAAVAEAGIRGRGGAAFPLGRKLRSVRANGARSGPPVVLGNGEEGEPASVKDKWLLRRRPHLVLDGMRLAAAMVGAQRAVVYVSDPAAGASMTGAVAELGDAAGVCFEVCTVDPSYVAGEETAAVKAVDGGPAKPSEKPPRPFEQGIGGKPTLVSNVETLAQLPYVLRHGAAGYRAEGAERSPGTFLATVATAGTVPGLYELPYGTTIPQLLSLHGVAPDDLSGVLMGGYFGGMLNRRVLDAALDYDTIRDLGAGLGCGAVYLMTRDECPLAVAAAVMSYYDDSNAGQCGSCFNGTAAMSAVLDALRVGQADRADLDRLTRWSVFLRGRGACGTLDGATNIAAGLLAEFPHLVAEHLAGPCAACAATRFRAHAPFIRQAQVPA